MNEIVVPNYRDHRFPSEIIGHAVWRYRRFALRYRDVEELLAERGVPVTYETVRQGTVKATGRHRGEAGMRYSAHG